MAPEQIRAGQIDHRADIYALGAILFEMAAGRPPFIGDNVLAQHLQLPAPDPREFRPDAPEGLARLICRCLAKDKDQRPAGCAEIAADLLFVGGASQARAMTI